jgi:RNA:NAD 2'-phosphotransferase (TPT1/KptA family)
MLLRHATPRRNLPSILSRGLLCARSKGRLPVVWLHSATATPWATLHVVRRHGGRVENIVILEVELPRARLRRNRRRLWFAAEDIAPDCIKRVVSFAEVAASPVALAAC